MKQLISYINKRFSNEYILALRERHQYDRQSHPHLQSVSIGDIVLVKDVNLSRLYSMKGLITKQIKGKDGLVRGVYLDTVYQLPTKLNALITRYNILYASNLKIINNPINLSKLLTMIRVKPPSEAIQDLDLLQKFSVEIVACFLRN